MYTTDAQRQAVGFVVAQTSHIESEVNAEVHPDIQYPTLIPVDTSANPFASTVTYYSSNMYGRADWINGNSNDIPTAGTARSQHETEVHTAGIGYAYGLEEIGRAQMAGINLPAEDALAARRAYEEMVERVALYGDAAKGFTGLTNHADATVSSAVTGDWATATDAQILADVNAAIFAVSSDTLHTGMANTLLLDAESMNLLATRPMGSDGARTLLTFLRENNSYTAMTGQPLTIRMVRGLETAGAGSTKRMVAYNRNPRTLKLHIPMTHRFIAPQLDGLNVVVPGWFRLGGLDVRKPKEVRYVDGI